MRIAFLHDTSPDFLGGAEMSNKRVLEVGEKHFGITVVYDQLKDFESTRNLILASDAVIVSNTFRCRYEFELFRFLIDNQIPYARWEHDYGFCAKRNGYCFVTSSVKNCCSGPRFKGFRDHFAYSRFNVFTSPKHYGYHQEVYGDAIGNVFILPPPIQVERYESSAGKQKDTVCFLGNLSHKKGGHSLIDYAEANPDKTVNVFGSNELERELPGNVTLHEKVSNDQVADVLRTSEYFFFKPVWPEPAGRVAAEAFLAGCKMITNDKVGTFSYPFYPDDLEGAKQQLSNGPYRFWESFMEAMRTDKRATANWENLLVYKSYGGLGDVFLALPAILKLKEVANRTTIAVPAMAVPILSRYVPDATIISLEEMENLDQTTFDKVIDIKNYPSFRKRKETDSRLTFPSHRRLLQHAVRHYIDAVATLHPRISNQHLSYPYFPRNTHFKAPFFTVHPGAGFLPKCWPAESYAQLIRMLLDTLPELNCKVILGAKDEDNGIFDSLSPRVEVIRSSLMEVTDTLSRSVFHIGNDSGISHLAGTFNIPSVVIHGPSGPGTWSSFAEVREVIWGKQGKCNIACNYNTAISCEHRACLTTVTPKRVFGACLSLFRKMVGTQHSPDTYILNPASQITLKENGVHIHTGEEEFFIDTHDSAIREQLQNLNNNRLIRIKDRNFDQDLISFLETKNVVFGAPSANTLLTYFRPNDR